MSPGGAGRAALVALLVSAALLAYEILLARAIAVRFFHHFATLAIGLAMLGFGASGTWLSLRPPKSQRSAGRLLLGSALSTPVFLAAAPLAAAAVPLDPTQLVSDAREWPRLLIVCLLLAVPFFTGSMAVLLSVIGAGARSGLVYGAGFLGSALGAAVALAATHLPPPGSFEITPYKGLPQVEAYPGARRVAERATPLGWIVAVDAPAFRHAPGLSLTYRGPFPRQRALFVDGQLADAVSDWRSLEEARPFLLHLPTSIPYALPDRNRVLVLGAGGGTEVATAASAGAREIVAVELQPELVRIGRMALDRAGAGSHARVEWIVGDARNALARLERRFDLISLGAGGTFGTSVAGVHSLQEDFLHTTEAYTRCLRLLTGQGVLSVTRWVTVPPRSEARAILTAAEALRRVAPASAERGLVIVRSWATATLLMKPTGFSADEIAALASWARDLQLDLDWHPGMTGPPAAPFHFLEGAPLHHAARAALSGPAEAARYAGSYPFDIAPATDARPYPHHYLRARSLGSLLGAGAGSWLPFAEWGYLSLVATLAASAVLGALLLGAALAMAPRGAPSEGTARLVGYFSAIGFAYLAAEIAALQQLGLLLGHPVYAVTAVLAAMLAFSGLGSIWSDRLDPRAGALALAGAALLLGLYAATKLGVVHAAQSFPLGARVAVAVAVLAPPAFLMGVGFPIGLRVLAGTGAVPRGRAWAVNGFASVVAAPLSAIIAMEAGSPALIGLAAAGYAAAAAALLVTPWSRLQMRRES